MPSPFPGMDPYLEDSALWPDVQHELTSNARQMLVQQLRPKYSARIELSEVVIVDDVTLTEVPIRDSRITIIDRNQEMVVTVIKFISPFVKISGSLAQARYREERENAIQGRVTLIEIDLLREGDGFPSIDKIAPHDYRIAISRAMGRPRCDLWPVQINQRLPVIPIPLAYEGSDAIFDLQTVLDTSYARASYELAVDYRSDPIPPLTRDQMHWADGLLRKKGLR